MARTSRGDISLDQAFNKVARLGIDSLSFSSPMPYDLQLLLDNNQVD